MAKIKKNISISEIALNIAKEDSVRIIGSENVSGYLEQLVREKRTEINILNNIKNETT